MLRRSGPCVVAALQCSGHRGDHEHRHKVPVILRYHPVVRSALARTMKASPPPSSLGIHIFPAFRNAMPSLNTFIKAHNTDLSYISPDDEMGREFWEGSSSIMITKRPYVRDIGPVGPTINRFVVVRSPTTCTIPFLFRCAQADWKLDG